MRMGGSLEKIARESARIRASGQPGESHREEREDAERRRNIDEFLRMVRARG